MHGLMMELPLLITDIMRFADRNHPDARDRLGHARHAAASLHMARRSSAVRASSPTRSPRRASGRATASARSPGTTRHLELYYAVSCIGAVMHTINPRLFPEQLAYIITTPPTACCSSTRRCCTAQVLQGKIPASSASSS